MYLRSDSLCPSIKLECTGFVITGSLDVSGRNHSVSYESRIKYFLFDSLTGNPRTRHCLFFGGVIVVVRNVDMTCKRTCKVGSHNARRLLIVVCSEVCLCVSELIISVSNDTEVNTVAKDRIECLVRAEVSHLKVELLGKCCC